MLWEVCSCRTAPACLVCELGACAAARQTSPLAYLPSLGVLALKFKLGAGEPGTAATLFGVPPRMPCACYASPGATITSAAASSALGLGRAGRPLTNGHPVRLRLGGGHWALGRAASRARPSS